VQTERQKQYSDALPEAVGPWSLPPARSASELYRSFDRRTSGTAGARSQLRDRACRALNLTVAILALPALLPLMLVIAAAVKLTSKGPALYRQARVGVDRRSRTSPGGGGDRRVDDLGGKVFTIYKFRTMYWEGEEEQQVWASPDDPRVTSIGRILRKSRLDELPQLFNVLKGDMNIVGPRPEQPEIFRELRAELSGYRERQKVLPGITGWAQVNHHYDQCIDDVRKKLDLDLEYIRRRSAVEDLRIMARTVPVVLTQKGAH